MPMDDAFTVYGESFASRLISGTALFSSPATLAASIRASGAEIVTVSLRRESGAGRVSNGRDRNDSAAWQTTSSPAEEVTSAARVSLIPSLT